MIKLIPPGTGFERLTEAVTTEYGQLIDLVRQALRTKLKAIPDTSDYYIEIRGIWPDRVVANVRGRLYAYVYAIGADNTVTVGDAQESLAATVANNKSTADAALLAEQTTRAAADAAEVTARTALAATVTANKASASADLTAEQTARVNADSTEVAARESLATQMRGGYTGTLANRFGIGRSPTAVYAYDNQGGVSGPSTASVPVATSEAGNSLKLALAYGTDGLRFCAKGGAPLKAVMPVVPATSWLALGATSGGANQPHFHVKSATYFPQKLADADLTALTV